MSLTLTNQRFGVEIETAGGKRDRIARAIATVTGGQIKARPLSGETWIVQPDDRVWILANDSSIAIMNGLAGTEIKTPILTFDDIPVLQQVIVAVKEAGARPNRSCSVHIHLDAREHTPQSIAQFVKIVYRNEEMIFQAVGTSPDRKIRYTKPVEQVFLDKITKQTPRTLDELNVQWFGSFTPHPERLNPTRYHALNLCNLWNSKHTLELRFFQSSLNPDRITSWIHLCLGLSVRASRLKQTTHIRIKTDNPKYNFRVFLVSGLGMIGKQFQISRKFLLKNLPGDSAFKHGRPTKKASSDGQS